MTFRSPLIAALLAGAALFTTGAQAQSVLKVIPHSNLSILDPIWTTAYMSRNHGYMIYDTLFSEDAQGNVKPQMVDTYETSRDGKTWTFKLRPGQEFHDGKPVTSEDVTRQKPAPDIFLEAARRLGWGRNTLTRKINELGIDADAENGLTRD
mgnify:CR=1 FL=1